MSLTAPPLEARARQEVAARRSSCDRRFQGFFRRRCVGHRFIVSEEADHRALLCSLVTFARSERADLCDLLDKVGPDAPTLCRGWNAHDLAAHLWIRENDPLGA